MIQTFFSIVFTILSTLIMALLAIAVSLFSRTGNAVHIVARLWGRSILIASRIKVTVTGASNVPVGQPCIFMSNHQSNFDIPVLLAHLKFQFRWLAKAELFKIPIFGRGMRGAGYISIDRSDRRSAFRSLAKAAETIRNGSSVLIFPEGTRSRDGNLQPFKKGGFVLSVDAGVPIVPVVLHGTYAIMPRQGLRIKPGPVHVEILEPLATEPYTRKTKDALMEKVREVIRGAQHRKDRETGHA